MRWIHSYIVREEDGALSAYCVYDAEDEHALVRHGEALGLPTDAIKPVFAALAPATV